MSEAATHGSAPTTAAQPPGGAAAPVGAGSAKPAPTEEAQEYVAAIMAAVEVVWPRAAAAPEEPDETARWRFSGRWWSRPIPTRRGRPY